MKYIKQVSVSEMYVYFATVHNTIATITAINPAITNDWTNNDSLVTICINSNIIMIIIAMQLWYMCL